MNILCHATYVGDTGYNSHSKNFFRAFSKNYNIKIRNFTVGKDWRGLHNSPSNCHGDDVTQQDKNLIGIQTLWDNNHLKDFEIYNFKKQDFSYDLNIILAEANHHYFYNEYSGKKIAYTVWESTEYHKPFFEKLKEYDQVWVPSSWQAQVTINQGISASKVKIVPEGVDAEVFYPENYRIPANKFRFLIFGRWDSRKSTKEIIRAFKNLFGNNNKFELIVSIEDKFNQDKLGSTRERLKHYDLECDNIRIIDFPDKKNYAKFLKAGHVFLSCARSEGWNLPLIEAMACGTPSIYSDCSGQLEFAKGKGIPVKIRNEVAVSEFYPEGTATSGNWYEPDFQDLEEKMIEVYNNYDYYKKKALLESVEIRDRFSWENAAQIAKNIIEKSYGSQIEKIKNLNKESFDNVFNKNIYENLKTVKDNDSVLDLGCSQGFFYFKNREKNINYIGIDCNSKSLKEFCDNLNPEDNPTLINAQISNVNQVCAIKHSGSNSENKFVSSLSFAKALGLHKEKINFLKFDLEGDERMVLQDPENLKLIKEKVKSFSGKIYLNCSDWDKQDCLEIIRQLSKDEDFYIKLYSEESVCIDKEFWQNQDAYKVVILSGIVKKNMDVENNVFISDFCPDPEAYHIINESPSLGDIIAWIPMVDKFQKEKNVKVNLYTPYGEIFQKAYPNINFNYYNTKPPLGERVKTIATFEIIDGKKWSEYNLQELAAKLLGVEYQETRPKIALPANPKNNFKRKYVCISVQSTAQFKYWNNPTGWDETVAYLNSIGYDVVCIDKSSSFGIEGAMNRMPKNCIDRTGDFSFEERINDLMYCDFFIGLTSGLSWLAWGLGKPVVFISGISLPKTDLYTPYRVTNTDPSICHGCASEPTFVFDKYDWNFCPKKKDFQCTKEISFGMVKSKIDMLIASEEFDHDFSLINARVSFNKGPLIEIGSEKNESFLVNLLTYHEGEWVISYENSRFLPNYYYKSFTSTRQRWRLKIYAFEGEDLKLVFQETYNEENKNVEFILDSESSKLDKLYIEKALVFEKENKCTVFIKTKYHEKLKKEFPDFNRIFDKDQELQNIYASYEIKRHEIESKRQNSFNTHKIWDRGRAAITFNHTENWLEYKQEKVFEDIIYSSYE